jgi:hypothetical protein
MKKPPEGSLSARTRWAHGAKAVSIGKSAPCEIPQPKHLPQSKTTDWPASGVDSSHNLAGDKCPRSLWRAARA